MKITNRRNSVCKYYFELQNPQLSIAHGLSEFPFIFSFFFCFLFQFLKSESSARRSFKMATVFLQTQAPTCVLFFRLVIRWYCIQSVRVFLLGLKFYVSSVENARNIIFEIRGHRLSCVI